MQRSLDERPSEALSSVWTCHRFAATDRKPAHIAQIGVGEGSLDSILRDDKVVLAAAPPGRRPLGGPSERCGYYSVTEKNTFFVSVNCSAASGPNSRPSPDCLKPPKGVL